MIKENIILLPFLKLQKRKHYPLAKETVYYYIYMKILYMHNPVLLFLLFIPILTKAQVIINYDSGTNYMSVEYTGCEVCRLGSASAIPTCECEAACDRNYDECVEYCRGNFTGLEDLSKCIEDCNTERSSCKSSCPEFEYEPVKEIIGYEYTLIAAWAIVPLNPQASENNWVTTSEGYSWNSTISIPDWYLPAPWPEIHNGNNTCYGIRLKIYYDDGTACIFWRWNCNFIG